MPVELQFADVLEEYHIDIAPEGHHHVRPGWVGFDCPYCTPNASSWRMGFNVESKAINCWNCGKQPLIQVLIDLLHVPYFEARKIANGLYLNKKAFAWDKELKPKGKLILPKGIGELLPIHRKYLENRKFDVDALVSLWDVQGIGNAANNSWSIFIPIHYHEKVVSWTTRTLQQNARVRYISARLSEEAIPHTDLLYGEDLCQHGCIVHEGPIDAWATGPGAVATFGVITSQAQISKMLMYPLRIICFDAEPEPQIRARKLCDDLEVFPGETINVVLETGKDTASASKHEVKELRKLLN